MKKSMINTWSGNANKKLNIYQRNVTNIEVTRIKNNKEPLYKTNCIAFNQKPLSMHMLVMPNFNLHKK